MGMSSVSGLAATSPRMRPYTGIGVVVLSQPDSSRTKQDLQLPLYEEPGLARVGMLDRFKLTGNEWVFGQAAETFPLIVSGRKGDWLRVYYDDAGREAWIDSRNTGRFQSWEQFLKLQTCHMLPGLQPQYYQLLQQPDGKLLATLTPAQVFKVLKLENSWGMILTHQAQIGWVRWSDEDGRLLVGLDH
jgi:SH3-like domain-containing protein